MYGSVLRRTGFVLKSFGLFLQEFRMNSYGVNPFKVLSRFAKL
jgi:hypothetical protein